MHITNKFKFIASNPPIYFSFCGALARIPVMASYLTERPDITRTQHTR